MTRRIWTTYLLIAVMAAAQRPPAQNTAVGPDGTVTFKTSTQLVIETVTVKDKSGKPIEGLTAKDFIITEDGVPQTIAFFEYQKLPEARTPPRRTQRSWSIPSPDSPRV